MSRTEGDEHTPSESLTTASAALSRGPVDFLPTIARLEQRANKARKRSRWAIVLLMAGAYGSASVLALNVLPERHGEATDAYLTDKPINRKTPEESLAYRVDIIANQLIVPNLYSKDGTRLPVAVSRYEESGFLKTELKDALTDLETAAKIADMGQGSNSETRDLAPIISTAVFSLGVVGIMVLLIQISVMFIRYHLRLAEFYDAQADALRASGGDPELAYSLLQHFSPNAIEIGKTPTTLYEKALDAIRSVASRSSSSP